MAFLYLNELYAFYKVLNGHTLYRGDFQRKSYCGHCAPVQVYHVRKGMAGQQFLKDMQHIVVHIYTLDYFKTHIKTSALITEIELFASAVMV